MREIRIKLMAVRRVHPLFTNNAFNASTLTRSVKEPVEAYIIIIIGMTISLAGNPSKNAMIMAPSSPINLPNGSIKFVKCVKIGIPPTLTLAAIHIMNPAGKATLAARPNTYSVRSKRERTSTFPI